MTTTACPGSHHLWRPPLRSLALVAVIVLCFYLLVLSPSRPSFNQIVQPGATAERAAHDSTPPPNRLVTVTSNGSVCTWRVHGLPVVPRGSQPSKEYFLPNLKNPCWLQELLPKDIADLLRGRMVKPNDALAERAALYAPYAAQPATHLWLRCLPYYYLLGAAKSATTDLSRRIRMHPQHHIEAHFGDPNWWSSRRFQPRHDPITLSEYVDWADSVVPRLTGTDLCQGAGLERPDGAANNGTSDRHDHWQPDSKGVTGDNSPFYLTAHHNPPANLSPSEAAAIYPPLRETMPAGMAVFQPAAQLIAIIREPGARLFSGYLYSNAAASKQKSAEEFHAGVTRAIADWRQCVQLNHEHRCQTAAVMESGVVDLHRSLYVIGIQQWLDAFPRDQLLILRTETYGQNKSIILSEVFEFLQLSPLDESEMTRIIKAPHMNTRRPSLTKLEMWHETRQLLTNFFRPFNERLAKLLKSDLYLWDDVLSENNE